jgi:hypothetical protein
MPRRCSPTRTGLRLALCAGPRLSQNGAQPTAETRRPPARTKRRRSDSAAALCLPRAFSDSAPVLETEFARAVGRRLARQAYAVADARGFVAFSRRDLHHPAAATRPTDRRSLRRLPALPRRLPHRRRSSPLTKWTPARCISYLTIELQGAIPGGAALPDRQPHLRLRRLSVVLPVEPVCPASATPILPSATASMRYHWQRSSPGARKNSTRRLAGSAIRRIGHQRWLRNIAVALGNASRSSPAIVAALASRQDDPSPLVREHVALGAGPSRPVGIVSGARRRSRSRLIRTGSVLTDPSQHSHIGIVGPATTLRSYPTDILRRVLDVTGLAVHGNWTR